MAFSASFTPSHPTMKRLRLFLSGLIVLLFSGVLMPVTFASSTPTPTFYQFDNGLIRIGGNSSGESSITSFGGLRGPQYFNQSNNAWYNLTISNSDMANAFSVGGDGTDNWNIHGSVDANSVQNVTLDTSGFVTVGT
jgi:hypothetical protein